MAPRGTPRSLTSASFLAPAPVRALLALALVSAAFLWGGSGLLTGIGNFLVVDDNPTVADAIVVLSGDGGARLEQGIELYDRQYAPVLILAGAGQPGQPPAAEVMARQAEAMGVPAASVLLVSESTSTREDALYTRDLMIRQGLKSVILVTSPYHERRASLTFARAFAGSGISIASYPVHDDQWHPDNWWQSGRGVQLTLTELTKLAYYRVRGFI